VLVACSYLIVVCFGLFFSLVTSAIVWLDYRFGAPAACPAPPAPRFAKVSLLAA
jgi:hypothetical protein